MEKYLYSNDNTKLLTKKLIELCGFQLKENNQQTIALIKNCNTIVKDTIVEVNNKYGYQLKPCQESIEKLNAKCLSNCISKMKNKRKQTNEGYQTLQPKSNQEKFNTFRNPNEMLRESKNPNNQQKNDMENLNAFSFSGGNEYAPIVDVGNSSGMIMSATGKYEKINNLDPGTNNLSKKDYANSLSERIEMQKRDLEQFTPNSPNEYSLDKATAEWLGIAGSTQQNQQYNPNQQQYNPNQQQYNPIQQQYNPNQQQPNQQQNEYQPGSSFIQGGGTDNVGTSLDTAFSGVSSIQGSGLSNQQPMTNNNNQQQMMNNNQQQMMNNNQQQMINNNQQQMMNNNQQQMINNNQQQMMNNNQQQMMNNNQQPNNLSNFDDSIDPNERLKQVQNERSQIDNMSSQYQTGQNFNPQQSPYENNKRILEQETMNNQSNGNSSVFFLNQN